MTNKELQNFKNCLHGSLKAKQEEIHFTIVEQGKKSAIKEIDFSFKNKDDVLIIQQNIDNCLPITNLFGNNGERIESCDFIVLLIKNKELKVFFCEIKSSNSRKNREKAKRQIESSKIFFEYLYKSYLHKYNKNLNFHAAIDAAKHLLLYPASMSQKKSTFLLKNSLIEYKIEVDDNGKYNVADGYKFFESK